MPRKPAIPARMADALHHALLPQGLRDVLPPLAEAEAAIVARLLGVLAGHGYERVDPPLVEFEENLLSGAGAAMATETFRLMDPISQRMIGVRADMTPQLARIASTRLADAPRPLRLCYAGQVLRVRGGQLSPERQLGQVGAELIGSDDIAADVEVLAIAAEALEAVGLSGVSVDLTLPKLVPSVCAAFGLAGPAFERLRAALDHKDSAAVAIGGKRAAPILGKLLAAAGTAEKALAILATLDLPEDAAAERKRLGAVIAALHARVPALAVTVDPVENRGFEYHTGISFTFFARGVRGEIARGGRYRTDNGGGEPATGFTLYSDTILQAAPEQAAAKRIYIPLGADPALARKLRDDGWVTVAGLTGSPDIAAEAKRLACGHCLEGGRPVAIS
jgi:ATP phosphoribosyltransferase regulatory subunit